MADFRDTILTTLRVLGQRQYVAAMEGAEHATEGVTDATGRMRDEQGRFLPVNKKFNKNLLTTGKNLGRFAKGTGLAAEGLQFLGTRVVAATYVIAGLGAAAALATPAIFQLLAITAAGGVLALGVFGLIAATIDRFNRSAKRGGTVAHELLKTWRDFAKQLRMIVKPAADIVLRGLMRALKILQPLIVGIGPPLRVLAVALEDAMVSMANGLVALGPKFGEQLAELGPVLRDLPKALLPLGQAFLNLSKIGGPGLAGLVKLLASVSGGIEKGTRSGGFLNKSWGTFTNVLKMGASAFKQLLAAIAPAKPLWDNVLWPFLQGFGKGLFAGIVGLFKVAIFVIKGFAIALGWIGEKLEPLRKVFYWTGYVIAFIFGPGKVFSTALKMLRWFGTGATKLSGIIGILFKGLKALGGGIFRFVTWPLRTLITVVAKTLRALDDLAVFLFRKLPNSVKRGVIYLLSKFLEVRRKLSLLREDFAKIPNAIKSGLASLGGIMFNAGAGAIESFYNGLKSKGGKVFDILMTAAPGLSLAGKAASAVGGAIGKPDALAPLGPEVPKSGKPYSPGVNGGKSSKTDGWTAPTIGWKINNYTILDGKVVAKSVAKHTDDKMARR